MNNDPIQHLRELHGHIAAYLGNGGMFNPEMMDHDRVREIMVDLNRALPALLAVAEAARAKVACLEAMKYCGDEEVADHVVDDAAADAAIIAAVAKLDEVK